MFQRKSPMFIFTLKPTSKFNMMTPLATISPEIIPNVFRFPLETTIYAIL